MPNQLLVTQYYQKLMIVAPLTFHSPETISDFLEHTIGTHNMLIKKGNAIVTFTTPEHNVLALRKYRCTTLKGHPLRLYEYRGEPDLYNLPEPMSIEPEEVAPTMPMIVETQISETARMVEQAIEIKDSNDKLEVMIKTHFKEVIEFISKYKPIYNTAKRIEKQLLNESEGNDNEKNTRELIKFTEYHLNQLKQNLKNLYKKQRRQISRFHERQKKVQINLQVEPLVEPMQIEDRPINTTKLLNNFHFANKQSNLRLKRLAALNGNQFVCTNQFIEPHSQRAKVKVYNLQDEHQVAGVILKEGAYGLNVIDKYLLVGNMDGGLSFWDFKQGNISNSSPFQCTVQLNQKFITSILKFGTRPNGFSMLTVSGDNKVKLFDVSEDLITDDVYTLFFDDKRCLREAQAMSIDIYQEEKKVATGFSNKFVVHDLQKNKKPFDIAVKENIYKIKKMKDNFFALGCVSQVAFLDPRLSSSIVQCYVAAGAYSICGMNEFQVCYGSFNTGELGLIDWRKYQIPVWTDKGTHKGKVYDILKMGELVISGDQNGQLVEWSSQQWK